MKRRAQPRMSKTESSTPIPYSSGYRY